MSSPPIEDFLVTVLYQYLAKCDNPRWIRNQAKYGHQMEKSVICVTCYVILNADVLAASSVWNDYQTHMRVRNWWKKLKNYSIFILKRHKIWGKNNSSVNIRFAAKTSEIRNFSQSIRSGNTDAYHPRVHIGKAPALW